MPPVSNGKLFIAKACTTFETASYSEIKAWQEGTNTALTGSDFELMQAGIRAYLSYRNCDAKTPAPFANFLTDEIIMAKARKVNESFVASFRK